MGFKGNLSGHRKRSKSTYVLDEKLAEELRIRLYFIPRGQEALRDDEKTSAELLQDGVIDGGCVSPISSRAAVTYAHKSHKVLREYDEGQNDEVNTHSLVEIRNAQDHSIRHKMKVIVVDTHHDFVILRSVDGSEIFEDYPYSKRSPKTFESFIGSSIDGEDSGGPCYAADRALIGIMVASTTTDPRLSAEDDRESIEEEIIEASSHPADTWITPALLIAEAYKNYQVKHGLLPVRRERAPHGPAGSRQGTWQIANFRCDAATKIPGYIYEGQTVWARLKPCAF
ncbi:unnamed protein product, partial [Mesorhabditis spiculigera]